MAFRVRSAPRAHPALPTAWALAPAPPTAALAPRPASAATAPSRTRTRRSRRRWLRRRASRPTGHGIFDAPAADREVGDLLGQVAEPDPDWTVASHDGAFAVLADDAEARRLQDELRLRLEQDRDVVQRYSELVEPDLVEPHSAAPPHGAADVDLEAEFWADSPNAASRLFGRRRDEEITLADRATGEIDLTAYEPAPDRD
jgi:hypothetical protein